MFEKIICQEKVDLKNLSTMRTGGIARFLLLPKSVEELVGALDECGEHGIKHYVIGNGSNVLFDDDGYDGALISLKCFDSFEVHGEEVEVGAGINLFALNLKLAQVGLSGLEFSYGIPATLGGFLVMNGGCFGHEISEFVKEVTVLDGRQVKRLPREDLQFSYRNSNLKDFIILGTKLSLKSEHPDKVLEDMHMFLKRKRDSQPCDLPSLGSVFKRIEGEETIYPAKIIDNLGLKGVKIGGAEVSTKHAGFIVNVGGATSEDVLDLIHFLETRLAEIDVHVEREIIVLKK